MSKQNAASAARVPALVLALVALVLASLPGARAAAQERPVLTLDEALAALEGDAFDMRQATLGLERAALLDEQADSLWRPRIDASAAYTYFYDEALLEIPDVYAPIAPYLGAIAAADPSLPALEDQLGGLDTSPQVVRHQHDVRGTLSVQQPIFQPLAAPLRDQAEALRREVEAGRDQALFALTEAVESLYFEAVAQRRVVEVAERNVALAELNLRRIRVAAAEEVAGVFEVNRAEVALARAERDRDGAATGYRLLVDALAEVLDRAPDFDVVDPDEAGASDAAGAGTPSRRSEHLRWSAEAARHEAAADTVSAEAWPTVVLEASATGQRETAFDDPVTWYVRVGLQWSLYDGGSRRVRRDQALLEARSAALRAEEADARAAAELRRARLELDLAELSAGQAGREAELAERNVEITREAWAAGAAGFVDVETAREQRLLAELALANAEVRESAARRRVARLAR